MRENDRETLRMLFETHQQQLAEKRAHIHSVTERVVGLLVVICGWLLVTDTRPRGLLLAVVVFGVLVICGAACTILYRRNRGYLRVARVVQRVNRCLGLFERGRFLPDEALYPESWKSFGDGPSWRTIWHHLTVIVLMTVICIVAAFR